MPLTLPGWGHILNVFFICHSIYIYYIDIIFLSYFSIYINLSLSILLLAGNCKYLGFFSMNEENGKNPKISPGIEPGTIGQISELVPTATNT